MKQPAKQGMNQTQGTNQTFGVCMCVCVCVCACSAVVYSTSIRIMVQCLTASFLYIYPCIDSYKIEVFSINIFVFGRWVGRCLLYIPHSCKFPHVSILLSYSAELVE